MNGNDYQAFAMRTRNTMATERLSLMADTYMGDPHLDIGGVVNGCFGLSGEVGEFNDMVKKWIFHEKDLDIDHAQKEVGDILWYIAMICESFGWNMDEIMQKNVDKLKARYPDGFDVARSAHRQAGDV